MAARCGAALAALVAVSSGCKGTSLEPLAMKAVEVGTAVAEDGHIPEPSRTFDSDATVYVSIATVGSGEGTVAVRWIVDNQIAHEEQRRISVDGAAHTAFRFKPTDGWPAGKNRVLFWLDGGEKHTVEFEVR